MLKVVYMGVPEFSVPALRSIHKNHQILAVYTQPDRPVGRGLQLTHPPVKKTALELGLPIFQPEKLSTPEELERLKELNPDVIVVAAYGHLLKQNILNLPRLGCVNIHSSLLPRWRGAAPIHWAILEGDAESGVSTMKMVLKLDAGNVLEMKKTPINKDETTPELHERLAILGGELIISTLNRLEKEPQWQGTVQDEVGVTYASKLLKEMELLSLSDGCAEWDRKIRGLQPWPGTRIILENGESLRIKKATPYLKHPVRHFAGIYEENGSLSIGLKDGVIDVQVLQQEGKKAVTALEYINGVRSRGLQFPIRLKSS